MKKNAAHIRFLLNNAFSILLMLGIAFFVGISSGVLPVNAQQSAKALPKGEIKAANNSVRSIQILGDTSATRVLIEFDILPSFRLFYMEKPNRFVVELNSAAFNISDESSLKPFGLIANARYGAITGVKSRIVFTLDGPSKLSNQELQKIEGTHEQGAKHRLVLELEPITQDQFSQILKTQVNLLGASGGSVVKGARVRAGQKKEGVFTVVLDPGHGGIDGGAVGIHKTLEKNITLHMAKLVGKALERFGNFKIVYTREKDVFLSLKRRRAFTKRQHADLMVSLHADTLKQSYVRGATIYTLAKKASDNLAAEVAASENLTDIVAGLAAPDAKEEVTDILADLTLRETTKFSKAFSQSLVNRMKNSVNLIKNPQRSASFVVLKNPDVPSVLLELGYLSNAKDEVLLNDPVWQENTASKIALAVREFFAPRMNANNSN